MFLKVSPMKGILRFERKGKLSPRFIRPFEILERIGLVAYKLALPLSLLSVHDVFHVSMLRKYVTDPMHVIDYKLLEIEKDLSYQEKPIKILVREVKALRNKNIDFVKILWRNHHTKEATWEREKEIKEKYPGKTEKIRERERGIRRVSGEESDESPARNPTDAGMALR